MASLLCMSNDGSEATFVGTFFPSGDSVRLCDECMPAFCAVVFERMTGVDMSEALEAASEGGEADQTVPVGHPEEVAAPPAMTEHGAPTDQPPAPAPADQDRAVVPDPTDASATSGNAAIAPDIASSTDVNSEAQDPTRGDTGTGGGQEPPSTSNSSPVSEVAESPPEVTTISQGRAG